MMQAQQIDEQSESLEQTQQKYTREASLYTWLK